MTCGVCRKRPGLDVRHGVCNVCWIWIRSLWVIRHRLRTVLEQAER